MNDGLFWTARMLNGNIQFFRSELYTKNAELYFDGHIPFKFLYVEDNEVKVLPKIEQDLILAAEEQKRLDDIAAAEQAELDRLAQLENAPFAISKLQLCLNLKELNKLEDFITYIESDIQTKYLWNAASYLSSDDPLLIQYLQKPEVIAILPEDKIAFLKTCKL